MVSNAWIVPLQVLLVGAWFVFCLVRGERLCWRPAIVGFAVAGAGFAYLGQGPISLESLQPSIAANLQSRLGPGFHVALGPTSIARP